MYPTLNNIHFVGIGGIGMSGIAEILLTLGCRVTGSDKKRSPMTDRLKRKGAKIFFGHQSSFIGKAQVVVISSAVSKENPEVKEAHLRNIPVVARAEMLAELMRLKYGIAVAGSHGKTTTTSLTGAVLEAGGLDPTLVIGGRVKSLRSNAKLGKGDYLVAEADESDGSFLHLSPTVAVVTNIDREHMEHYRDFETLRDTFDQFLSRIPFFGLAVLCQDHPVTAKLASKIKKRHVTYGFSDSADYQALNGEPKGWGSTYDVSFRGDVLGAVTLNLPGRHNVLNSLAAIAIGRELGVTWPQIRKALHEFKGIGRRLEKVYDDRITVVDDYGHHPEEIKATLKAARSIIGDRRLWVLFQPHRYTRTKDLFEQFTHAFGDADRVLVSEIYSAGEPEIHGVSGQHLVDAIQEVLKKKPVQFVREVSSMAETIVPLLKEGDFVLTMGAGDIWKVGKEIVTLWKKSLLKQNKSDLEGSHHLPGSAT